MYYKVLAIFACIVIGISALPAGFTGLPGAPGQPRLQGPAGEVTPTALIIVPMSSEAKMSLTFYGSGFVPGEKVRVIMTVDGVPYSFGHAGTAQLSTGGGIAVANETGTFKLESIGDIPVAIDPGVYTVEAVGDKGSRTTALLEKLKEEVLIPKKKIPDTLNLEGTAAEVGRIWAKINRDSVLAKYELYMAWADVFFSKEKLVGMEEELKVFAELSKDIAKAIGCSHWIEELNAMADEIGIDRDLFISYNFGRYGNLPALYAKERKGEEGCTSFAITDPATKDGQIIFHKTRDMREELQAAYVKKITGLPPGEKVYKFFGEMGTSDIGISFFVNEKGLAGAADATPPIGLEKQFVPEPKKYDGLMNHMTLRYFAEKCKNVEEVRKALHSFVEKGYVATGGSGGTHYLFADAEGNVLHIADNCHTVFVDEINPDLLYKGKTYPGIYFTRHREDAYGSPEDALISSYGNITVELADSAQVGRHPAMWTYRSSQSSFTVLIDPKHPETLTTIFVALPAYGYSIPFLMGATETPRALLDGTVYTQQKGSYRYSEYQQSGINDIWKAHLDAVRKQLAEDKNVVKSINDNFLYMVKKVLSMNYTLGCSKGIDELALPGQKRFLDSLWVLRRKLSWKFCLRRNKTSGVVSNLAEANYLSETRC